MKKIPYIFLLICCFNLWSQDYQKAKEIGFHSFSLSNGFNISENFGGITFAADVSYRIKKHLIKLQLEQVYEIDLIKVLFSTNKKVNSFTALNLFYGREFNISKKVYLEFFTGLGKGFTYRNNHLHRRKAIYKNIFTVPLQSKLHFIKSQNTSLGIQLGFNFNSIETLKKIGFFIQFKL